MDAVVALLIISLTVVLSLQALGQARRTAALAVEIQEARALIAELMFTAPETLTAVTGDRGGFAYRIETDLTGADRPIEICRRAVDLRDASTGRRYGAATLVTCPAGAAT